MDFLPEYNYSKVYKNLFLAINGDANNFLSELIFRDGWDNSIRMKNDDSYFHMSQSDIEINTGLSAKKQLNCCKILVNAGLILTAQNTKPSKKYYKIHYKNFIFLNQLVKEINFISNQIGKNKIQFCKQNIQKIWNLFISDVSSKGRYTYRQKVDTDEWPTFIVNKKRINTYNFFQNWIDLRSKSVKEILSYFNNGNFIFNFNSPINNNKQNEDNENMNKIYKITPYRKNKIKASKKKNPFVIYASKFKNLPCHKKPETKVYQNAAKLFNQLRDGTIHKNKIYQEINFTKRNMPTEWAYRKWTAKEIKQGLKNLNNLCDPSYNRFSNSAPKNLADLIINSRTGFSWLIQAVTNPPIPIWKQQEKNTQSYQTKESAKIAAKHPVAMKMILEIYDEWESYGKVNPMNPRKKLMIAQRVDELYEYLLSDQNTSKVKIVIDDVIIDKLHGKAKEARASYINGHIKDNFAQFIKLYIQRISSRINNPSEYTFCKTDSNMIQFLEGFGNEFFECSYLVRQSSMKW